MRLIAHRGFAGLHPENTLPAVEAAVELADAVEVDVRRCGSGELVVIHDESVDRVSDGEGPVADHTLAELRDLDVLDTGAGVPTLAEVLDVVPPAVGVNVELKEADLARDALDVAAEAAPQVTVSSFVEGELAACRELEPAVPRAYLFADDPDRALDRAGALDCAYLHPPHERCDERLVDRAHRAGMSVNAWTVDDEETAERLADVGVDGVIADRRGVLPEVA